MTDWAASRPGTWYRNIRLGEWISGPLTPSFATWGLPAMEAGFAAEARRMAGWQLEPPLHVVVNGWAFHSMSPGTPASYARAMVSHPRVHLQMAFLWTHPYVSERLFPSAEFHRWRAVLEDYRRSVDALDAGAGGGVHAVDRALHDAGRFMWTIAVGPAGLAWKAESALAAFHRRHLAGVVDGGPQVLLRGLREPAPPGMHAVDSIDWVHATLGETEGMPVDWVEVRRRHTALRQARHDAERRCRASLGRRPLRRWHFDRLLDVAQRSVVAREEQVGSLTLAWPALRRWLLGLGDALAGAGALARPEDVFFLERQEIGAAAAGDRTPRRDEAATRRAQWKSRHDLDPPLKISRPDRMGATMDRFISRGVAVMKPAPVAGIGPVIDGLPASPGVAKGRARVLRTVGSAFRLEPGEVLVAPLTTPAWTPLFAVAAAVVTDGGNLAAHASLVAREFGIPAVVATGSATRRIRTGDVVEVDGTTGTVRML